MGKAILPAMPEATAFASHCRVDELLRPHAGRRGTQCDDAHPQKRLPRHSPPPDRVQCRREMEGGPPPNVRWIGRETARGRPMADRLREQC